MIRYHRLISFILILLIGGLAYWVYYAGHREYSVWLIPFVIALVIAQIFAPQIEWWGAKAHPVRIDSVIRRMLLEKFNYYRRLPESLHENFDKRLWLIMKHKEWIPKKLPSIPEDIKAIVMAPAIVLTMHQEDFLFEKYERIVLYKHPFPSPKYHQWHASETHHEDGVLIFSIEQLFNAFLNPSKYYNIAYHEWAGAWLHTYGVAEAAGMKCLTWELLEKIAPYGKTEIEAWLGLPVEDLRQVTIHHYFVFPDRMKREAADSYTALNKIWARESAQ